LRSALGIVAVIGLVFALALPAFADAPGNNGTVKIHEGGTEDEPIVANEPHVCTFHLHFFFGDDVQAGDWEIQSWPPTGDGTVVLSGSYDATGGEDRVPDEPGTFSLPNGHYKLFWDGAVNPGGQLEIKHKVFWVDCPSESESQSQSQSQSESQSQSQSESQSQSQSQSQSESQSESQSQSQSQSESQSESQSQSQSESQSASGSESESASASSSEGVLGGNPTPAGEVPDTATGVFNTVPATILSIVFLGAVATLVMVRLARER